MPISRNDMAGVTSGAMGVEKASADAMKMTKTVVAAASLAADSSDAPVPVILLHGFAQTGATWNEIVAGLRAKGHATYAPDLVDGMPALSMDRVCEQVADLVCAVARTHGRCPVLVGYSMGGRIALETLVRTLEDRRACRLSVEHPPASPSESSLELPLAGLLLEGAGLGPADEDARVALEKRNRKWAHDVRAQGVEAFMDAWASLPLFASQASLPERVRARLRAERVSHDPEALAASLEELGQHRQAGEARTLAALVRAAQAGLPICYVVGELDQKYAAVAQRVSASVPQADIVVVPNAGHNVHLEQPRAYVEAVCDFARSSTSFASACAFPNEE